jgi:hypothetical protein
MGRRFGWPVTSAPARAAIELADASTHFNRIESTGIVWPLAIGAANRAVGMDRLPTLARRMPIEWLLLEALNSRCRPVAVIAATVSGDS